MTNKDLISQYVDTGLGIPRYQFDKLSSNDKGTYLRKMQISIEHEATHKRIDNVEYYYGELPESTQIKIVSNNGNFLPYITKTPSQAVQLAAVNNDGMVIMDILNLGLPLTKEVELAAVKQNGGAIQFINNPSEEIQLVAVTQSGAAIQYIKNPSHEVQMVAVTRRPISIQYIDNPSEEIQMAAINRDSDVIQYIDNPSELVQVEAVKDDWVHVFNLSNPSELVQMTAVKQDYRALVYISRPTDNVIALHNKLWVNK